MVVSCHKSYKTQFLPDSIMSPKRTIALLSILLLLLLLPPVVALPFSDQLGNVWNNIITIGNLNWLGYSDANLVLGLMRILLWFLIFTLFFAVTTGLGGEKGSAPMKFFGRKQAAIVAAIIATITAVFLPASVLLATGAGWATVVAFVLIGLPVVGIAYLLWKIPWEGEETKFTVFLKLILCLVLFWVLSAMKYHLDKVL